MRRVHTERSLTATGIPPAPTTTVMATGSVSGVARMLLDEFATRLQLLGVAVILASVRFATKKPPYI